MSKAALYQKLARAMDNFDPVLKEANNPFFKSKYANLNSLLDATVPALRKEGLILLQPVEGDKVITMVVDTESGESVVSWVSIPTSIVDPQKLIAATTYFRRGGLQCLLSIQALDDDGNYVSGKVDKLEAEVKIKPTLVNEKTPVYAPSVPTAGSSGFKRPIGAATKAVSSPAPKSNGTKVWDDA